MADVILALRIPDAIWLVDYGKSYLKNKGNNGQPFTVKDVHGDFNISGSRFTKEGYCMSISTSYKRARKTAFENIIEIAGLLRYIPPHLDKNLDHFITTFEAIEIKEDKTVETTVSNIGYLSKIDLLRRQ
jgi:hypothetical protein